MRTRWLPRLLANPVATLLLFGLLAFDALSLPWHQLWQGGASTAGRFIQYRVLGRQTHTMSDSLALFVVREGTHLRLVDPDNESWDEMTRIFSERPRDVLSFGYRPIVERHGFWAMTREADTNVLHVEDSGGTYAPEERARARSMVLDRIARTNALFGDDAALNIQRGDYTRRRVMWMGYAHNAGSLAALLALIYSLAWIPKTPEWLRRVRRRSALTRSRCPRCGYSIAGLPQPKCPECGEDLSPTPDPAARREPVRP